MSESSIYLNVIPLNLELDAIRCSFYESPIEGRDLVPLNQNEMPVKLKALHSGSLYTDFKVHEGADTTVTVNFEKSPKFAKHYLNAQVYEWFKDKARLRRKNFIRNNELYFLKKQDKQHDLTIFDRYRLRASIERMTDGPELTVMYSGTMKVWSKSILSYEGSTKDFKSVVYKGHIYRYRWLIENQQVNRNEVYPVINKDIGQTLGLPSRPWKRINKVKRHNRHIDDFYER